MFSFILVTVVVVIAENTIRVSGCSCAPASDTEIFCRSDWVSVVRITSKGNGNYTNRMQYTVSHISQFKPPSNTSSLSTTIMTPNLTAACGLTNLKPDETYLLAGKYDQNEDALWIFACGQFIPFGDWRWSETSDDLKQSLTSGKIKCSS